MDPIARPITRVLDKAARQGCRPTDGQKRMSNVESIRARVETAHYTVDATAVAAAIVARLLAGRVLATEIRR